MAKELKKCTGCNGFKKTMGLGLMQLDCKSCKGIGWVEVEEEISVADNIETNIECASNDSDVTVQKKRGRPRGNNKWQDDITS